MRPIPSHCGRVDASPVARPRTSRGLAVLLSLAGFAVGCGTTAAGRPVRVVRSSGEVASCRKVGDVSAERRVDDREVLTAVAEQARSLGGNTVLLESGARSGSAYLCEAPAAGGH